MKLYIAGPLFNEGEIKQRLYEGKLIKEKFKNKIDVFNPIEQPFNENKQSLPKPEEIFSKDTEEIINCDIFLADITNEDSGVMVELGIAIAYKKIIIIVNSDIRLKSANKYEIPSYSINHYVLGAIKSNGILVYSFNEALEEISKLINKNH